ncbi:MAG: Lrp/AsnC family transcriptional regulator [Spirochaetes bacterium]|nr:Lrp/AsnC family transcriptional regulator [Spirochaetota bacterium]
MMNFTVTVTAVLNRIQKDFPLAVDPFEIIADELSMKAGDLLEIVRALKEKRVIRNISGIFNGQSLGYVSSLIAFRIDDAEIERAASAINAHPGVSHNYLRDHTFNIWFTLAAGSGAKLEKTVSLLAEQSKASDYIILKNERLLKIGLMLGVGEESRVSFTEDVGVVTPSAPTELSAEEKEAVRLLQRDLPITRDPFSALISESDGSMTVNSLLETAGRFRRGGVMRRYSAVIRHREAGFMANAMTVWKPAPEADIESISGLFRAEPRISHLYMRTVIPGKWEYPLFAMVHARNDAELTGIIEDLSVKSGIRDYLSLRSVREFKKERIRYFTDKFEEWEIKAGI